MAVQRLHRTQLAFLGTAAVVAGMLVPLDAPFQTLVGSGGAHHLYYVATSGNDGEPGTPERPVRTIAQCARMVVPGDTCLIGSGTYHEAVTPPTSGTAADPITFTAQTPSDPPLIDGADPLTGTWTQVGSTNVYTLAVTLPVSGTHRDPAPLWANQVFSGTAGSGTMLTLARWPQQSSQDPLFGIVRATAEASTTVNSIVDSHIPAIDWTGATVHQWGQAAWTAQTAIITSSTSGQVGFALSDPECPTLCALPGTRYYLDGIKAALRYPGQYYYDGAAGVLSVWMPDGASPQGRTLEAKARMWAFDLGGRQHLTLSHLTLWAASITTTATSAFDVLDGITVTYPSAYDDLPTVGPWLAGGTTFLSTARFAHALDSGIVLSGTNNVLENSVVAESAGNGVLLSGENITVTNNLIHDADYMGSYAAPIKIYHPVSSTVPGPDWVTHNTVYNSGRDGIQDDFYWSGNTGATDISYNDVWNYGVLNGDLGAIRDCCAMNGAGMAIHHNWLHDIAPSTCVACTAGAGLYLDNGPRAFTQVHHNVAWNDGNAAYFANSSGSYQAQSITVQNNTAPTTELGFWLGGTTNNPGIVLTNNIFRGGADTSTGASSVSAFNLSGVDAGYVDAINHDYRLAGGSAAIDAGTVIPGVTDGFVGAAPDQGAYEFGGADWVPGCARSVSLLCVDPHTPGRYVP